MMEDIIILNPWSALYFFEKPGPSCLRMDNAIHQRNRYPVDKC